MSSSGISFPSNAPRGVGGKGFTSLFFLFFFGLGTAFCWLLLREEVAALRTWTWQRTPCEIVFSRVGETDSAGRRRGNYSFEVSYRYTYGGQSYTSERYKRSASSFSDYGAAARLVERFPIESAGTCYVNPTRPGEAVLQRDNFYLLPMVLLPLLFMFIGAGGLYYTWRPKAAGVAGAQSISTRADPARGQRVLAVFCLIFMLVGLGMGYGFFLRPMLKILAARNWPAVPCDVLASQVQTHRGNKGNTYSVNILYRYEFKGREFKSNRYHFMGGSSSGYGGKQAIVNQHPPGSRTVCYVNPAEPTEAVLERGFTPDLWAGLIPLAFVLFGALGLVSSYRNRDRGGLAVGTSAANSSSAGVSARGGATSWLPAGGPEPRHLKPQASPLGKFFGLVAVALFWNGVVSVFVFQAVQGWRTGHGQWFLTLFMVPFVLIGLALVGGIVYSFLALFNPRPHLVVSPGAVPLGGELRVEWEIAGRVESLQRLSVRLQGREEATYQSGKNTRTETSVFADVPLLDTTSVPEMRSSTKTVTVPAHLMHSFAGKNNRVIWSLKVDGQIPRWPDVKEDFPVTVVPGNGGPPKEV